MPETPKSFEEWWYSLGKRSLYAEDGEMKIAEDAWNAAIASLSPQAAAVPARQDAVPDKEKCPQCGNPRDDPREDSIERMLVCGDSFHSSTQPPQAAVGEGELPLTITVEDRIHAHDDLLVAESDPDIDVRAWTKELRAALYARNRQLREAIAQRDEARREQGFLANAVVEIGIAANITAGSYPMTGPQLLHLASDCTDYVARLAALDVPKPESEEIERLIRFLEYIPVTMLGVERNNAVKHWLETRDLWLTRLRSLPSDPGSGVQRKAVEND